MSNLREAYSATQFAGLAWDENREKAIDRVAAAGHAQNLEIWKAGYGLEASALIKLTRIMLAKFTARYPREQHARRVVEQALHEYLNPHCRACTGAGVVKDSENINATVPCTACHGSGVHRHSDTERSRCMGVSCATAKYLSHKLAWLLSWLGEHDREVNRIINIGLERQH